MPSPSRAKRIRAKIIITLLAVLAIGVAVTLSLSSPPFAVVTIVVLAVTAYYLWKVWHANAWQKHYFETVSQAIGEGLYVMDENGRITLINPAALAMLGLTLEAAIGKEAHALFHCHDGNAYLPLEQCPIFQTISKQQPHVSDELFRKNSGEVFPVRVTAHPFLSQNGLFSGTVTTFLDMSERKTLERELRQSELRYRTFVELSSDFLFLKDRVGRYVIVNRNLAEFFGRPLPHILGKTDFELLDPQAAKMWQVSDTRAWESGIKIVSEDELGGRIYETTKYTILHEGQIGLAGIIRDVTSRKANENALLEATQAANLANQSKSEFLANMSHEIRTPMNAILGLCELALSERQTCGDCSMREALQQVDESSKILLSILNDILDYSKIEAGKITLENRPFNLGKLCARVFALYEPGIRAKGVDAILTIETGVPRCILGDEYRLAQVFTNILSNAQKFTESGKVTFHVCCTAQNETEATLYFTVTDTGIGMTTEQCTNLFQSFTQADTSTTRKYGGTGLGLAISVGIARAMQAQLEATSEPSVGSTFSLTLTARKADCGIKSSCEPTQMPTSLPSLRVLIVEDHPINQEIVARMLGKSGLQVAIANNGQEGVAMVRSHPYDLILMDIQMPLMDGYEATQEIRRFNATIPIIALTAAALVEDREKALQCGMNDHLSKPIKKDNLLQVIQKWAVR